MAPYIPLKYRIRAWIKARIPKVTPGTHFLFCLALSNALAPGWMRFRAFTFLLGVINFLFPGWLGKFNWEITTLVTLLITFFFPQTRVVFTWVIDATGFANYVASYLPRS